MSTPATAYVPRREEAAVLARVEEVRADGVSRALLVYGAGGTGKTTLVHTLARTGATTHPDVAWVQPLDVDDSEYWLLSNLETAVARSLDPDEVHFGPFFEHLAMLPALAGGRATYESVVTDLGQIDQIFLACYRRYVRETGCTVVVTLDTVEAIRSMYLLLTLTQWMKELPATLFVLSGRPLREGRPDPIREELGDPHRPLAFTDLDLGGFAPAEAEQFVRNSPLHDSLTATELDRLVELTGGQPLWLALAVEYLQVADIPPEMLTPVAEQDRPHERFRRRLTTLYRSSEFWPEAIKRLAVVRHSVNREVWEALMADRDLPGDADSWERAWERLLLRPWIRPRANARYVTLHDALAEELAQRLIPLHDQDESWRRELWSRARDIYARLTEGSGQQVREELSRLSAALRDPAGGDRSGLVQRIALLDARKRELDQLLTAQLHYEVLVDFRAGTDSFLRLYEQASDAHDPLFTELICHEMERFVPRGAADESLEDVVDVVTQRFRRWLLEDAQERHVEIALCIAGFLIRNAQPHPALQLLRDLPGEPTVRPNLRYRLANERGNASLRIAGQVGTAERHFRDALARVTDLPTSERVLVEAQAHKELGFYFRNVGRWQDADEAYRTARNALARITGPGSPAAFREEMASIQTNWAYLKALRGSYREARNLVDSAIAVRQRFGHRHGEGVSLSVSGEVHRYGG